MAQAPFVVGTWRDDNMNGMHLCFLESGDDHGLVAWLDGRHVPFWSVWWSRIGELQRARLIHVEVLSKHMAVLHKKESKE